MKKMERSLKYETENNSLNWIEPKSNWTYILHVIRVMIRIKLFTCFLDKEHRNRLTLRYENSHIIEKSNWRRKV